MLLFSQQKQDSVYKAFIKVVKIIYVNVTGDKKKGIKSSKSTHICVPLSLDRPVVNHTHNIYLLYK